MTTEVNSLVVRLDPDGSSYKTSFVSRLFSLQQQRTWKTSTSIPSHAPFYHTPVVSVEGGEVSQATAHRNPALKVWPPDLHLQDQQSNF